MKFCILLRIYLVNSKKSSTFAAPLNQFAFSVAVCSASPQTNSGEGNILKLKFYEKNTNFQWKRRRR